MSHLRRIEKPFGALMTHSVFLFAKEAAAAAKHARGLIWIGRGEGRRAPPRLADAKGRKEVKGDAASPSLSFSPLVPPRTIKIEDGKV